MTKDFLNSVKVVKFRQIWSHCLEIKNADKRETGLPDILLPNLRYFNL